MEPGPGKSRPNQEYTQRLRAREERRAELERQERWLGSGRVVVFLIGLAVAVLSFKPEPLLSKWWIAVPVAAFFALVFWHERVTRDLLRAGRAVAFYKRGLARLEDRWEGGGQQGERFIDRLSPEAEAGDKPPPRHPNAADLDLFGRGSLFELLCTARTRTGEDTLADWLKAPAAPDEVRARQAAVEELRSRLDLREDLALLGSEVPVGVDFGALIAWGEEPPALTRPWMRWVCLALGIVTLTVTIHWLVWYFNAPDDEIRRQVGVRSAILLGTLAVAGTVALSLARRVNRVIGRIVKKARDLALLAGVLGRLEREEFSSPRLVQLRAALAAGDEQPSARIARLYNLIDLLNSRRNQVFLPFAVLLLWGTQMAYALEGWRRRTGPALRGWLAAVGQFEALCAFATYAYENPDDPFPEIVEEGPCVVGEKLGHPLIPEGKCIRNDIRLDADVHVLIVSGSNMSGKSTMLRTVGINTVLALAGAPVRAKGLRVSPLVVGATLRIQDSLQAGHSRFYAELLRVRQIVDLSRGQPPLLFLLDEIFHGTNSHDRRQGAEAVVRGLVEAGAIGLVTTHDLSLTHIAEELAPRAQNVHFADHFEEGKMVFDYTMRPGVVRNSNAIALMRAVGLEV